MSFLRTAQTTRPWMYEYTGQQIQGSTAGVAIPIVYGTNKVSFNQIWQGGFYAVQLTTNSSGGGGGKGGGHSTVSGYAYYTAAVLALCEGPIQGLGTVWYGTDTNLDNFGYDLYTGTTPQTPWSFLTANYSAQALPYGGVAYMAAPSWYLGSSASFPSVQVEVKGVLSSVTPVNGLDTDPALIIQDFLTNSQYGVGFPPASIDATTLLILSQEVSISIATPAVITWAGAPPENGTSFTLATTGALPTGLTPNTTYFVINGDTSAGTCEIAAAPAGTPIKTIGTQSGTQTATTQDSYQTYCQASGLALSPTIINQETASSILTRWLQLTNTAALWSGGTLKFIPYGDLPVTGDLFAGGTSTFTPNTAPIYDLDDDDYVHDGDNDPVQISRVDPFTVKNWLALTISQRTVQYSDVPIEAWNQNAIEMYGLRKASQITAHEICDPAVGQIAAQLILQRGLSVRNTYQFKLSFEYCLLEPMDLVTLTDSGLGLSQLPVRITAIEEDDAGLLSITAEDFPIGSATATVYVAPTSNGVGYDSNVAADPVNPPIIFEPPAALTNNVAQIWAAVSGGSDGVADPYWGGASVYVSLDNTSYTYIGNTGGPARQGVLSGDLPAFSGTNPDTTDTLSVSMAESGGTLTTASSVAASTYSTLSIVDDELISYETVTLTGSEAYNITTLYRGLYGSTPVAHSADAPFSRLDNLIFQYDLPSQYVGVPLYFKFQSFNLWGQGQEDLSTCAVYDFTPTGSGVIGPVSTALLAGPNLDYGDAATTVNESDDWGLASDPYTTTIDLGLASD